MRHLKVRPLTVDGIASCYPIWRLELPALALEQWHRYAAGHLRSSECEERGILIAEDHRDCVLGALVYEIDHCLRHERLLSVLSMSVHDFFPSARREVATALLDRAEQLARARACRSLQTTVSLSDGKSSGQWLTDLLLTSGHRREAVNLVKVLAADGSAQDIRN